MIADNDSYKQTDDTLAKKVVRAYEKQLKDAGGSKPTIRLAKKLNITYAVGSKYRPEQEIAEKIGIICDLEGKQVAILTDDETVSFSSMLNIAKELYTKYDIKQIYSAISHMNLTKKIFLNYLGITRFMACKSYT